ncbi:MAG: agmatinase [Allomuricauda sp.]
MDKIILQGIKFDAKSSYQKGARKAPPLIRDALFSGSMNLFSEDMVSMEDIGFLDKGDFHIEHYFDIGSITDKHLAVHEKVLTLGGDHSITYPIIKAFSKQYPKLDILHLDAHADLYHSYDGDPYSHACPFARIMEEKLASRLVQVGIRTLNPHQTQQAKKYNVEIHSMRGLDITTIPKFENPLYISLDMDVFDPAFAPGVSHHEPGGMTSRQVIELIHRIEANVVGADIVEYNPERDVQGMTAYLAAKILKELLSKMANPSIS